MKKQGVGMPRGPVFDATRSSPANNFDSPASFRGGIAKKTTAHLDTAASSLSPTKATISVGAAPTGTSSPAFMASLKRKPNAAGVMSPATAAASAASSTSSGGARQVFSLCEVYLKARIAFAQGIADLAARDSTVDNVAEASPTLIPLLRPLLLDESAAVRQAAALALGRLANYSAALAHCLVDHDVIPHIVASFQCTNRFYRKAAAFVLRSVARHSADLACLVVQARAVDALAECLRDADMGVREAAVWTIGSIAKHNEELAQNVVDSGLAPMLCSCLYEPEISLLRVSASAAAEIAKHSPELAHVIVDAGAIKALSNLVCAPDSKLRRQACATLAHIAQHSSDLAECVADGDLFPAVLSCFKDIDVGVRKQAVVLLSVICKNSLELSQLTVNCGGVAAVIELMREIRGVSLLPAVMTLGYVSAFSETLSLAVIVSNGVAPLVECITREADIELRTSCAWALGQMGRHSPDHAKALAAHGTLLKLLSLFNELQNTADEASVDKVKMALKNILIKTLEADTLEPLLQLTTPPGILRIILEQYAKILPQSAPARRQFVTSGACRRLQEIAAAYRGCDEVQQDQKDTGVANAFLNRGSVCGADKFIGSRMADIILKINSLFPEEVVRYFSPGYCAHLLDRIDEHEANANSGTSSGTEQQQQQQQQGNAASSNTVKSSTSNTNVMAESQILLGQNAKSTDPMASANSVATVQGEKSQSGTSGADKSGTQQSQQAVSPDAPGDKKQESAAAGSDGSASSQKDQAQGITGATSKPALAASDDANTTQKPIADARGAQAAKTVAQ